MHWLSSQPRKSWAGSAARARRLRRARPGAARRAPRQRRPGRAGQHGGWNRRAPVGTDLGRRCRVGARRSGVDGAKRRHRLPQCRHWTYRQTCRRRRSSGRQLERQSARRRQSASLRQSRSAPKPALTSSVIWRLRPPEADRATAPPPTAATAIALAPPGASPAAGEVSPSTGPGAAAAAAAPAERRRATAAALSHAAAAVGDAALSGAPRPASRHGRDPLAGRRPELFAWRSRRGSPA